MPVSPRYQPDPQHPSLCPAFFDPVEAANFPETILRPGETYAEKSLFRFRTTKDA